MTDIFAELKAVVGEANVLTGKVALDWPSIWETRQPCRARAVVKPGVTMQQAQAAADAAGTYSTFAVFVNVRGATTPRRGSK